MLGRFRHHGERAGHETAPELSKEAALLLDLRHYAYVIDSIYGTYIKHSQENEHKAPNEIAQCIYDAWQDGSLPWFATSRMQQSVDDNRVIVQRLINPAFVMPSLVLQSYQAGSPSFAVRLSSFGGVSQEQAFEQLVIDESQEKLYEVKELEHWRDSIAAACGMVVRPHQQGIG